MSLDKAIKHGKERRKQYRRRKSCGACASFTRVKSLRRSSGLCELWDGRTDCDNGKRCEKFSPKKYERTDVDEQIAANNKIEQVREEPEDVSEWLDGMCYDVEGEWILVQWK
ncbi:MAG TPA: hypothetical protein DCS09_04705 [Porphyromonadaceae bacterium]|nr:hypothetical protein [Porphyromonadaceae bacterium]